MVHLFFVDAVETTGSKCCPCVCGCFWFVCIWCKLCERSVLVTRSDENGQLTMTDLCTTLWAQYECQSGRMRPRAHAVIQTPDGTGVIVPDLGTDKLVNYKLDRKSGKLVRNPNQPVVQVASGEGAPSFRLSPLWAVWISAYRNRKPYLRI